MKVFFISRFRLFPKLVFQCSFSITLCALFISLPPFFFAQVLFEGGAWVDERAKPSSVKHVPLRCYGNDDSSSGGFGSSSGGGSGGVGGRGESDWKDVDDAPLDHSGLAHDAETAVTQGKGNVRPEAALGTSYGLLLNELEHAPAAAMAPLMTIFKAALELKNTSVYSPDAQFILFLVESAVHVEAYLTHAAFQPPPTLTSASGSSFGSSGVGDGNVKSLNAHAKRTKELRALRLDLRALMLGPMAAILDRWADVAGAVSSHDGGAGTGAGTGANSGTTGGAGVGGGVEGRVPGAAAAAGASAAPSGDLPTLCVVHAYRALLYSNSTLEELGQVADPIKWTAKWVETAAAAATTTTAGASAGPTAASTSAGAFAGVGSSKNTDSSSSMVPARGEETLFARLLGGAAFVPNWHGFGLGQQRSDLLRCLGGDARDNEQRLLRFLQV